MSISFSSIPQIISLDETPRGQNTLQHNDGVKIKIPTLQEKFQNRLKNDEDRLKQNNNKLMQQLQQNKIEFQKEQEKLHKAMIKQKKHQNYELLQSMSDGQPKHPQGFKKANKQLEVFRDEGVLLPTIEQARTARAEEVQQEKDRKAHLKTKALSSMNDAWLPTKQVNTYFDNTHMMQKPDNFKQVSSDYPDAHKKLMPQTNKDSKVNTIRSLVDIPMNIQENSGKKSNKDDERRRNGPVMSQSYLEQTGMKPTSANNLMLLQQQLAEEKTQAAKSMHSLASIKKSHQSLSNISTADNGSSQKNKQWVNAYHQKEIFSRPLYNNLDIKLQGNNPHFKPFKPTKTSGYDFNQYVSLDAGERDSKSANTKKMQNIQDVNLESEPIKIKAPQKYASLNRIDDFD